MGVASINASTASAPIRQPWTSRKHVSTLYSSSDVRFIINYCFQVHKIPIIISKKIYTQCLKTKCHHVCQRQSNVCAFNRHLKCVLSSNKCNKVAACSIPNNDNNSRKHAFVANKRTHNARKHINSKTNQDNIESWRPTASLNMTENCNTSVVIESRCYQLHASQTISCHSTELIPVQRPQYLIDNTSMRQQQTNHTKQSTNSTKNIKTKLLWNGIFYSDLHCNSQNQTLMLERQNMLSFGNDRSS